MKTLSINEMEIVNGGLPWRTWLSCGAIVAVGVYALSNPVVASMLARQYGTRILGVCLRGIFE